MGSSGEMATTDQIKREQVGCSNAAVSNGKAVCKPGDQPVCPRAG